MTRPDPTAWMFVHTHARIISDCAARYCPPRVDREDMQQELAIEVARRHHAYDASKGSPCTWIHWQARAVATRLRRSGHRMRRAQAEIIELQHAHHPDHSEPDAWTARRTADRRAEVALVVRDARPLELEAMSTVVAGLTKDETRDRLGITSQGRNHRLRRMGDRLTKSA